MADELFMNTFEDYEDFVIGTVIPGVMEDSIYPVLGLGGEAGEVVDNIKKLYRKYGSTWHFEMTDDERASLIHEIGDVYWYLTRLTSLINSDTEEVLTMNALKLIARGR